MHSIKIKNTNFIYSPDMSGKVQITVKHGKSNKTKTIEVEGSDLLDFVAEYVRIKTISELEQMETNELLKKHL